MASKDHRLGPHPVAGLHFNEIRTDFSSKKMVLWWVSSGKLPKVMRLQGGELIISFAEDSSLRFLHHSLWECMVTKIPNVASYFSNGCWFNHL